jgi:hypothetical protein
MIHPAAIARARFADLASEHWTGKTARLWVFDVAWNEQARALMVPADGGTPARDRQSS